MRKFLQVFLSISFLCTGAIAFANEPANLGKLKREIIEYVDSGEYLENIEMITFHAKKYLERKIDTNKKLAKQKKLAIVMDIDETALSNFKILRQLNFGCEQRMFSSSVSRGKSLAIKPALDIYNYALTNDVAVFFVTGRFDKYRMFTIQNLEKEGYKGWTELYMRPDDDKQASVIPYKTSMRKKITRMGYEIVLNIGDQKSDLDGGYADKTYRLPNPFYTIK